jgi:uncharacterized protein YdhG (YjbR/CyaY superfamily)
MDEIDRGGSAQARYADAMPMPFPPPFFVTQKATVEAAGYDAGEGFIKLPYERELPIELLKSLM